eukprot:Gb_08641 [translate_table: standard]
MCIMRKMNGGSKDPGYEGNIFTSNSTCQLNEILKKQWDSMIIFYHTHGLRFRRVKGRVLWCSCMDSRANIHHNTLTACDITKIENNGGSNPRVEAFNLLRPTRQSENSWPLQQSLSAIYSQLPPVFIAAQQALYSFENREPVGGVVGQGNGGCGSDSSRPPPSSSNNMKPRKTKRKGGPDNLKFQYRGVRQLSWGKCVAEIRHPGPRIQVEYDDNRETKMSISRFDKILLQLL